MMLSENLKSEVSSGNSNGNSICLTLVCAAMRSCYFFTFSSERNGLHNFSSQPAGYL